jgi:predicted unusual protein kinase regulating ubiquinone biosynthesis (AarF/ABC1/UbiB family)
VAETPPGSGVFGELRRLARTSGAVGGIAARVAGERVFGIKTDRAAHADDLRAVLGGLKGPLMKAAQFLSTVPDMLPAEYAAELAQLQSNAPPMGWSFVRRRMAGELGADWQKQFADFGHEASAAASLGQVHRATLPDGRDVACKLQYPDMPSVVEADLRQLKLGLGLFHRIDKAIDNSEVFKELAERLREELDYTREAAQMRLYRLMLAHETRVFVPAPIEGFCTHRLLTMTWLNGMSVQKFLETEPSQEQRNAVAEALFRAWYIPLYRYGIIHGDPHLGNYQVREDGGINLLDFGAIRVFAPSFLRGTLNLYEGIRDNRPDQVRAGYERWGFGGINQETIEVLNEWARFLYEPLMQDRVRPIQEGHDTEYGRKVAASVHAGLKRAGGVRPPREFVLMDRSAVGLGAVFLRLRAEINFHRLFNELIDGFDEAIMTARQNAALVEAGVPIASGGRALPGPAGG